MLLISHSFVHLKHAARSLVRLNILMLRRLMMNTYARDGKKSINEQQKKSSQQRRRNKTTIYSWRVKKKTNYISNNKTEDETSNSSFFLLLFCLSVRFLCLVRLLFIVLCVRGLFKYIGMAHNRINHDDEGNVYASPSICLSFQSHFSWCFIHSFDEKSRKRIRHKSIRFYLCKS